MLVKVILVVSLLKICAGDGPSNSQPQSHQAISSQSFVRHDVPMSYKFSSVHIYSTPKPDQLLHQQAGKQPPQVIQYAPIYKAQNVQNLHYPNHNVAESIPENFNVVSMAKTHLEPKPQKLQNLQHQQHQPEHLSYVPGYNVELLQAVNRYPGHNAVYRSYPNMAPNDKINKVNFLNQYILYPKPEQEYITTNADENHSVTQAIVYQPEKTKPTLSPFVPKQIAPIVQKPKVYNAAHIAAIKAAPSPQALMSIQDLIPHPKAHRMLLNIARTYNIAGHPQKAQHPSLTMLKNVPSHTHAIIHIPGPADVERNTRLLPMENKQIQQQVHRLS